MAIQSEYYGVRPALEPEVAAMYLKHGVGSYILHEDHEKLLRNKGEVKRGTSLIMGMPPDEQELRTPYPAASADIGGCMELAKSVISSFPGWEYGEFLSQLKGYIDRGEAWLYRDGETIAALLLYSLDRREIDCLAVHPQYRRRGLAGRLVETAAARFPVLEKLFVTTYRSEDARGEAARSFYRSLGFSGCGLIEAFGCPCERLSLTVPDGTPVPARE